jgi:hypothetical protein
MTDYSGHSPKPPKPLNLTSVCPRHPWNPVAEFIAQKHKHAYCYACIVLLDNGVKLEEIAEKKDTPDKKKTASKK